MTPLSFWRKSEWILAFAFFTCCFALFFPDLFCLVNTPMSAPPSTLSDPTVSWSAFAPAFREFRYELFENGNILWSGLRGMGQPMMGNEVQGAPLFPLNLALIGLPDQLYWSVMPIARVILISLCVYLIARHLFGLSVIAALVFALLAGFNFNVTRWMNHPWSNGLLAGLWYFYFLCKIALPPNWSGNSPHYFGKNYLRWNSIGLIIAVFGMITNGFPEASALMALFVIFIFSGFIIGHWPSIKAYVGRTISLFIVCHFIGFALSAIQIFALLEFIDFSQAMDLRKGFSGGSFTPEQYLPYITGQFSIFSWNNKIQTWTNFYIGLFTFFFALNGAISTIMNHKSKVQRRVQCWIAIAFIASMVFYVLKALGLSSAIEWIFANTPVLGQSHFPLYFSPLFFFGAAYFAALGVDNLLNSNKHLAQQTNTQSLIQIAISLVALVLIIKFSAFYTQYFHGFSWQQFVEAGLNNDDYTHLRSIIVLGAVLILYLGLSLHKGSKTKLITLQPLLSFVFGLLIIGVVFNELKTVLPNKHDKLVHSKIHIPDHIKDTIQRAFDNAPVPRYELRGNDLDGNFVGQGLATVDNGVSAILPPHTRQLRLSLFKTRFGGYVPLSNPLKPWSYEALSHNLVIGHNTPKTNRDWSTATPNTELNSRLKNWPKEPVPLVNPFYLEGQIVSDYPHLAAPEVWLHMQTDSDDFWIKTNPNSRYHKVLPSGLYETINNWRIRIEADFIRDSSVTVTIREFDGFTNSYFDFPPQTLLLDQNHPSALQSQNNQLLSKSPDESLLLYFNQDALPRAYIASGCKLAKTQLEEMQFFTNNDNIMQGQVVLSKEEAWPDGFCQQYTQTFQRVAITSDSGSSLDFAPIQGPALFILNDTFYPGWHVSEKKQQSELTIKPVNTAVRAVYLPENREYQLSMNYQPKWLNIVYILLILSLIAFIFMWLRLGKESA